ncbi:MAG: CotH kinase family protein, partial [Oscillospiraceae bacterium]|nr:CotH kinase family protein [Oscillospiraceae bacterium]
MANHRYTEVLCAVCALLAVVICLLFMGGETLGLQTVSRSMGYETRLFDQSRVHTIDIVMDDWQGFIETCETEQYALCSVVIDGEAQRNVAIRAKGNTSLSMVTGDRYSFKLEFDHYDSANSYYGLDKLCLNNLIQDNTLMKDYLTYTLMAEFGVDAPLCSYAYITVNGEDFGLYLAVEAVEDSYLSRTERTDGELYKPDSMDMGGGRGNGMKFEGSALQDIFGSEEPAETEGELPFDLPQQGQQMPSFPAEMPRGEQPQGQGAAGFEQMLPQQGAGAVPEMPDGFDPTQSKPPQGGMPQQGDAFGREQMGGMGSSDVKLQYMGDDTASYSNIFNNAKTDITAADKARLISALQTLSGENAAEAVDVEQVLRYFVVHNYVVNGDSYTGQMVHNYYLSEENGKLAMIPWDYNLAFGGFQSGDASSAVNDPIDTPLSVGSDDRPMADWIFASEEYTAQYHELFRSFLQSVDVQAIIADAQALIAPYAQKDPTAYCSYDEFTAAVQALQRFCLLRSESVAGQLQGSVPSTAEAQRQMPDALVAADDLELSVMGSMGMGGMGMGGGSI